MTKKIVAVLSTNGEPTLKQLKSKKAFDLDYRFFKNMNNIRDPLSYLENAWCLKTLTGEGNRVYSDIDGFRRQINDYTFLEFKKSPSFLNHSQLNALIGLAKKTEGVLLLIFGDPCLPQSCMILRPGKGRGLLHKTGIPKLHKMNLARLQWLLSKIDAYHEKRASQNERDEFFEGIDKCKKLIINIRDQHNNLQ
ncbi:hypothetical protein [Mangrovibacillus cuniculi]|uniref:Uncharacterized protein n=1 Tax=Mangrovibacillus cuniculi TaxID=2593652 RepID=A0A7S8CCU3_9BACI|nr:hypothetical protein [Mangrovibacillus cuniculi]QPC47642.1 hypothetical protein G8O30_12105 [Mangrovibacillus cuniculi]